MKEDVIFDGNTKLFIDEGEEDLINSDNIYVYDKNRRYDNRKY